MPQIEELPTTGPSAVRPTPGWALVPDSNYIDPSKAPLNPTASIRGKRSTRFENVAVSGDVLSSRKEREIRQRLEHLNSENRYDRKEVAIAIPKKAGDDKPSKKQTTGVRKILLSDKAFKHHLEDEVAHLSKQSEQGGSSTSYAGPQIAPSYAIPQPPPPKKRKAGPVNTSHIKSAAPDTVPPTTTTNAVEPSEFDVNPLLATSIPPLPSQDELLRLITAPPLSYNAARAAPASHYASLRRHFCDVCGYWGDVKCLKCGGRVCSLVHKAEHDSHCSL
ncbi:hypothetical protein NA57DRAFT_55921 [Rhizodiscina lignyota]|uniref:HIT-type domain-containing protein n=1 Tax=Rhizodiscina lignyota TaxID=1504668 RepID=A0A9P4IFH4_9PEZI|nr:hypothetical protein NA57DRAFT_55921 [Rhizodiscina lignyota]